MIVKVQKGNCSGNLIIIMKKSFRKVMVFLKRGEVIVIDPILKVYRTKTYSNKNSEKQ